MLKTLWYPKFCSYNTFEIICKVCTFKTTPMTKHQVELCWTTGCTLANGSFTNEIRMASSFLSRGLPTFFQRQLSECQWHFCARIQVPKLLVVVIVTRFHFFPLLHKAAHTLAKCYTRLNNTAFIHDLVDRALAWKTFVETYLAMWK